MLIGNRILLSLVTQNWIVTEILTGRGTKTTRLYESYNLVKPNSLEHTLHRIPYLLQLSTIMAVTILATAQMQVPMDAKLYFHSPQPFPCTWNFD
jgi:hypothetical protein